MSKAKEAAHFAAVLSEAAHFVQSSKSLRPANYAVPSPHIIADDVLALQRIAATVARWAVRACNGEGHRVSIPRNGFQNWSWEWGEDDDKAKDRADARALTKASEIAKRYGATVSIGGDPRGFTMRLVLPTGRTNGWGEGWGVA